MINQEIEHKEYNHKAQSKEMINGSIECRFKREI